MKYAVPTAPVKIAMKSCVPVGIRSEPQREAAQTAVHLLKLRHFERVGRVAEAAELRFETREPGRNQETVVDAKTIGGVLLAGGNAHELEIPELLAPGQRFDHGEPVLAEKRDAALQVKD